MSSQVSKKNHRYFITNKVNTPLVFHKLRVSALEQHVASPKIKSPTKTGTSKQPKIGATGNVGITKHPFFHVPFHDLEPDEAHFNKNLVNSLDMWVRKDETRDYPKVLDDIKPMLDSFLAELNDAIAEFCKLHFASYHDEGSNSQTLFRQRSQETRLLFGVAQRTLDESYMAGVTNGNVDGKNAIEKILGLNPVKDAKVFQFMTKSERTDHAAKGKTSFNRCLPVKLRSLEEYQSEITQKKESALQCWDTLGKHVECLVTYRVAMLISPGLTEEADDKAMIEYNEEEAVAEEKFWDEIHTYNVLDLSGDVTDALCSTYFLGYAMGYQHVQTSYKNRFDIHNPWVYSIIKNHDDSEDEPIYVSTKKGFCLSRFKRQKTD